MSAKKILAWHFLAADRKLPHGDGRPVKTGSTLEVEPPIIPCKRGLHGSIRAIDALKYAPQNAVVVCRVELSGVMVEHGDDPAKPDKVAASRRKVLAMADCEHVLREFACDVAEMALRAERKAGREPDPRSWKCVEVARAFLKGKASRAAESAARRAALSAAESAALSAARSAAWSAALSAARSAALSAARSAAWSAARSAAESAARSAAESAAWSATWSAARSAARSAAESAAESAADRLLEKRLKKLLGVR